MEIKCFICKSLCDEKPAQITYVALDENDEKQTYIKNICNECEKMMELIDEFFKKREDGDE